MSCVWRPETAGLSTKHLVLAALTNGTLAQYHALTGKLLAKITPYVDAQSQQSQAEERDAMPAIYCAAYSKDGSTFAAGAKSGEIFIYDEMVKKKLLTLSRANNALGGDMQTYTAHSGRVCACK